MPIPLISRLPRTAGQVLPFVQSGVRRGLSSRVIEQSIRSAGISVSRSRTILPLMRDLRAIESAGANIRHIAKQAVINVNRLPAALTPLRRRYSYTVRVMGLDPSGARTTRYITVTSNSKTLTPGQIESSAMRVVNTSSDYESMRADSAVIEYGMRADNII